MTIDLAVLYVNHIVIDIDIMASIACLRTTVMQMPAADHNCAMWFTYSTARSI